MGFFKKIFGQDDDQLEYNNSYDSDNDYDDDVDLDDYDDDEDNSDSPNKSYSIAKVRVVGFDKLDEEDKDYVRKNLKKTRTSICVTTSKPPTSSNCFKYAVIVTF